MCDLFRYNRAIREMRGFDIKSNFVSEDGNEGSMFPETISLILLHAGSGQRLPYDAR